MLFNNKTLTIDDFDDPKKLADFLKKKNMPKLYKTGKIDKKLYNLSDLMYIYFKVSSIMGLEKGISRRLFSASRNYNEVREYYVKHKDTVVPRAEDAYYHEHILHKAERIVHYYKETEECIRERNARCLQFFYELTIPYQADHDMKEDMPNKPSLMTMEETINLMDKPIVSEALRILLKEENEKVGVDYHSHENTEKEVARRYIKEHGKEEYDKLKIYFDNVMKAAVIEDEIDYSYDNLTKSDIMAEVMIAARYAEFVNKYARGEVKYDDDNPYIDLVSGEIKFDNDLVLDPAAMARKSSFVQDAYTAIWIRNKIREICKNITPTTKEEREYYTQHMSKEPGDGGFIPVIYEDIMTEEVYDATETYKNRRMFIRERNRGCVMNMQMSDLSYVDNVAWELLNNYEQNYADDPFFGKEIEYINKLYDVK